MFNDKAAVFSAAGEAESRLRISIESYLLAGVPLYTEKGWLHGNDAIDYIGGNRNQSPEDVEAARLLYQGMPPDEVLRILDSRSADPNIR